VECEGQAPRSQIVALCARLEALGVHAIAKDSGISLLSSTAPTDRHPPGYYVTPESWGGCVPGTESLSEFAEAWLNSENAHQLKVQLGRDLIVADERHTFLIVAFTDLMHMCLTSDADGELSTVVTRASRRSLVHVRPLGRTRCCVASQPRLAGAACAVEASPGIGWRGADDVPVRRPYTGATPQGLHHRGSSGLRQVLTCPPRDVGPYQRFVSALSCRTYSPGLPSCRARGACQAVRWA
jgi:hypothetical protein